MFRAIRSVLTGAVCLVGWGFAVVELPASTLIFVALLGTGIGLAVRRLRRRIEGPAAPSQSGYLVAGCLGLVLVVAVNGLAAGAGGSGVAVVALTALMWPAIPLTMLDLMPANEATRSLRSVLERPVSRRGRSLRDWPTRLRAMSDGSICYAWGTSSQRLKTPLPASEHLALVLNRAHLLDELERRDPDGFANWTAHGLDLTIDPVRFINSAARADGWGHQHGEGG